MAGFGKAPKIGDIGEMSLDCVGDKLESETEAVLPPLEECGGEMLLAPELEVDPVEVSRITPPWVVWTFFRECLMRILPTVSVGSDR